MEVYRYSTFAMKKCLHKFLCIVCALLMVLPFSEAQQQQGRNASKKKEQAERAYKKAYAKARKRTIKHRYDIQSKNTKEMMDAARKRADAFNSQNDPKLADRIFKRKRPRNR